ncbi:unnamed protein product [Clonostachys rhizophaga]|uniref:Uncharacterized protein n=1 Tax=Clonostachys rhizophaga TaxID=160324 RepID=A0A9N9VIW2_9HYPO|nr:unnamed protein product [Clonostachys rhizophaga]
MAGDEKRGCAEREIDEFMMGEGREQQQHAEEGVEEEGRPVPSPPPLGSGGLVVQEADADQEDSRAQLTAEDRPGVERYLRQQKAEQKLRGPEASPEEQD